MLISDVVDMQSHVTEDATKQEKEKESHHKAFKRAYKISGETYYNHRHFCFQLQQH